MNTTLPCKDHHAQPVGTTAAAAAVVGGRCGSHIVDAKPAAEEHGSTPVLTAASEWPARTPKRLVDTKKQQQPAAYAVGPLQVTVSMSGITDPGVPGHVNQDTMLTLWDPKHRAMIVGIFDGHGKESGREAAVCARAYFELQFKAFKAADYQRLEENPKKMLQEMYAACHQAIKSVFRAQYERRGYIVYEDYPGGFLVKREHDSNIHACVRGGTTATVVVILDGGRKIIASNVGDSAAMLGSKTPMMKESDMSIACLATNNNHSFDLDESDEDMDASETYTTRTEMLMLTGDHSAESIGEFFRIRGMCRSKSNPNMPELRFLYDAATSRSRRVPLFGTDKRGSICQNFPGDYYKNVRDEWATVVATPSSSPYPDALAFTRSLGDFHMHKYGVSAEPSVIVLPLEQVARRELAAGNRGKSNQDDDHAGSHASELLLVVCSDGVWDNWKYEDAFRFLFARSEQLAVDQLVAAFMEANQKRAAVVFGDQADNMTAVVCRFTIDPPE